MRFDCDHSAYCEQRAQSFECEIVELDRRQVNVHKNSIKMLSEMIPPTIIRVNHEWIGKTLIQSISL